MNDPIATCDVRSDNLWLLCLAERCLSRVRSLCDTHDALAAAGHVYHGLYAQQTEHLKYAVMTAICVIYAKPFTRNGKSGPHSKAVKPLKRDDVVAEKKDRVLHDELMSARHNAFAHQNPKDLPFEIYVGGADSKPSLWTGPNDVVLNASRIPAIRAMCGRLHKEITGQIEQEFSKRLKISEAWATNVIVRPAA